MTGKVINFKEDPNNGELCQINRGKDLVLSKLIYREGLIKIQRAISGKNLISRF